MGTSLTPNLNLVIPDSDERLNNWDEQVQINWGDILDNYIDDFLTPVGVDFPSSSLALVVNNDVYEPIPTGNIPPRITFTAPVSGKILVLNQCEFDNGSNVDATLVWDLEIRQNDSTGTIVYSPSDTEYMGSWRWDRANAQEIAQRNLRSWKYHSGLVPKSVYWVAPSYKVQSSANPVTIAEVQMMVIPLP